MQLIYEIFGYPLGFIMWGIYYLVKNYGIAILLFTLVTKILLFPLSVKQQKNTAMMSAFQPKLQALQKKYANNQQKLQEEQMKLYAEEGINPMSSCLPMLIQFPVLFGIIDVVYRPLTHIMHFSKDMIAEATLIAQNVILEAQANGEAWATVVKNVENLSKNYQSQLIIMQAYNDNPAAFASMPELCEAVSNFDMNFLGIFDLGVNPTWTWPTLLIPILAGLSQLLTMIYSQAQQKKTNPDNAMAKSMNAMTLSLYIMPIISIFIARNFPMAVGYYWICQSIFGFFQQVILSKVYTPEKVAELVKKDAEKKKKKKGKGYMERMYEKQLALLEEQKQLNNPTRNLDEDIKKELPRDEEGNIKISKSMQKDLESKIIADARKRMEEKYKDEVSAEDLGIEINHDN